MNKDSWEAYSNSAAFGVELQQQLYSQLRKVAQSMLEAEGVTIENLRMAGQQLNVTEDEAKACAEAIENAHQHEVEQNSLFITAIVNILPQITEGKLVAKDEETALAIYDTAIGLYGSPYYVLGYRYSDNTALVASPAPSTHPNEFGCHTTATRDLSVEKHNILKPSIFTYHPRRIRAKEFRNYMKQDYHIDTDGLQNFANLYDRRTDTFCFTSKKHKYDEVSNSYGFTEIATDWNFKDSGLKEISTSPAPENDLSSELLSNYGIYDLGLVRLMTRYNKGSELIGLLQDTAAGYIGNIVLTQEHTRNESAELWNPLSGAFKKRGSEPADAIHEDGWKPELQMPGSGSE